MKLKLEYVFPVVAAGITFFYYKDFLYNFFAYDDYRYIENTFHGPGAVILGYSSLRVISNIVWWPLYMIFGHDPSGYNLFSILLYFINSILLYRLLQKKFNNEVFSFLAGSLFVASGVCADVVFWKAGGISALINVFFCLLSLHEYIKYNEDNDRKSYLLSLAFFLLAVLSKEEAASLPFIILSLELFFFDGLKDKKKTFKRILPFFVLVAFYLILNHIVFRYWLNIPNENFRFFKVRPLYSLFGWGTVFFLNPGGFLKLNDPRIYVTGAFILTSFFFVKEKRILIFGYLWIFFTFLPQSTTTLGQFEPRNIFNSISRYLYFPCAGASIVIALVILRFRDFMAKKYFYALSAVFISFFIWINYNRVHARGEQWQNETWAVEKFLYILKSKQPKFPENSYVQVYLSPPQGEVPFQFHGRSYIQQSLRAFYQNTKIFWVNDWNDIKLTEKDSAFVIIYYGPNYGVEIKIVRQPKNIAG
jgi:hypothetical protein